MVNLVFQKIACFHHWLVHQTRKSHNFHTIGSKMDPSAKNCQKLRCYQHFQTLLDAMRKQLENLKFVQGVDFGFIDSVKNNGTSTC